MAKSKAFQGRSPEDVLNELTSVKDLLYEMEDQIEDLLNRSDSVTDLATDLPAAAQAPVPEQKPAS